MIIETKLFIPKTRGKLIVRSHLNHRLNEGLHRKLTIVTAPAGYGKSTLLSEWVTTIDAHIGWISLDESDNNPVQFWAHTIGALKRAIPSFCEKIERHSIEIDLYGNTHIFQIINLLHQLSEQTVLIWDDFHVVNDSSILNGLSYLLERTPPHVHFFIASRNQPSLPISRLRIEGHLVEFVADDLRFDIEETKAFFNECTELTFNNDELLDIFQRTEGWAAGMRMAALSINQKMNETKVVFNMTGKLRHVADYFFEEVLSKQPKDVQRFLLKTSILERMNASLCEAITNETNSSTILHQLERENLFLVSLDKDREWYRYHHLFQEFLHMQLQLSSPEQVKALHETAGRWFEENGFQQEALEHYLSSGNYEHALRLLERMLPLMPNYEWAVLHQWLNRIPNSELFNIPIFFLMNIASLYLTGYIFEATEKYCWAIDKLENHPNLLSQKDKQHYGAGLDFLVAFRSFLEKDFESFVEYSKRYLEQDPDGGFLPEFGIEQDGYHPIWDIYLTCESENLYKTEETLRMLLNMWGKTRHTLFLAHLCLDYSVLLYERNRLEEAEYYTQKALGIGKECDNLNFVVKASLMLAQIAAYSNRKHKSDQIIHQLIIDVEQRKILRLLKEIKLFQMRDMLKDVELTAVVNWANENGFSVSDEISVAMIEEYELFARMLWMQGQKTEAMNLTNRLLTLVEKERKPRHVIRLTILKSLLLAQQNQMLESFQVLENALSFALPNGFLRVFLDEGMHLEQLLKRYVQGVRNHYINRSKHVNLDDVKRLLEKMSMECFVKSSEGNANLSEHLLTNQQMKVLKLMQEGLSNKEMAEELDVSLSTVKTHINHLYRKLGVHNRMLAIKKAQELNFFSE